MDVDQKAPPPTWLEPTVLDSKSYEWSMLRVERILNKRNQLGVRAAARLSAHSLLPYYGLEISEKRHRQLLAIARDPGKDNAKQRSAT